MNKASRFFKTLVLCLLVVTLSFPIMSCSNDAPMNLLVITVDTLRPDRLGYTGHTRSTSPEIDALAARGTVFNNAYSVAGWTLPSVATLMTGHYPKDHTATDFHWTVDGGLPTLAAVLRRNGYYTMGFVSHVLLTPTYGMSDGFKHYDFSVLNHGHPHDVSTSKEITDLAIAGMADATGPFFLWAHYFDPHFEYLKHPQYPWGDKEIDLYDAEIAFTDFHIGRLLKKMPKNTLVVFTSDHGEEFGEHNGRFHYTLYNEVMRVPFVIAGPGVSKGTNDIFVEQVDLMPTVLNQLGVPYTEGRTLPGRDLLDGVQHDALFPVFFERDRPPGYRQRGILLGTNKLFVIEDVDTSELPEGSRGTHAAVTNVFSGTFAYDLAVDPLETKNIYDADNQTHLFLLAQLQTHFSETERTADRINIDPELIKKLKSLGYIR